MALATETGTAGGPPACFACGCLQPLSASRQAPQTKNETTRFLTGTMIAPKSMLINVRCLWTKKVPLEHGLSPYFWSVAKKRRNFTGAHNLFHNSLG